MSIIPLLYNENPVGTVDAGSFSPGNGSVDSFAIVAEIEGKVAGSLLFPIEKSGVDLAHPLQYLRGDLEFRRSVPAAPQLDSPLIAETEEKAFVIVDAEVNLEVGPSKVRYHFARKQTHSCASAPVIIKEPKSPPRTPFMEGAAATSFLLKCLFGKSEQVGGSAGLEIETLSMDEDEASFVMRDGKEKTGEERVKLYFNRSESSVAPLWWLIEQVFQEMSSGSDVRSLHLWMAPVSGGFGKVPLSLRRQSPLLESFKRMKPLVPSPAYKLRKPFMEMDAAMEPSESVVEALSPAKSTSVSPREDAAGSVKPDSLRQLQTKVTEASDPARVVRCFEVSTNYKVGVRIGLRNQSDPQWANSEIIFPDHLLPPSTMGHTLSIVFLDPVYQAKPLCKNIHLPATGESETCEFDLKLDASRRKVAASIVVVYRNRILCSAVMTADVGGGVEYRLDPQTEINPGLSNLDKQRPFDGAFYIGETAAGEAEAVRILDEKAVRVDLDCIKETVGVIDGALGSCDWADEDYSVLSSEKSVRLLRFLARHGSMLHDALLFDQEGGESLGSATRLQIVSGKAEARLPVEFCYDGPSPDDDAILCPFSKDALTRGVCANCQGRSERTICPLGFWALNRIVEWHRFDPRAPRELGGNDFAFEQRTEALRGQMPLPTSALFAASQKVDAVNKNSTQSVKQMLSATMQETEIAGDWGQWRTLVASHSPALLMLLPHSDKDDCKISFLEIGGNTLGMDHITKEYVRSPQTAFPPIVFLLGCSTAKSFIAFEGAVARFRRGGAAIVVSTTAPMLGRQASAIAVEFLQQLKAQSNDKKLSFGQILLSVRRAMLLKGVPAVLAVVSYGDADWQLT
jgi:hypothetical protein